MTAAASAHEILAYAHFTDIDAQLEQLAVDAGRTPARVLFAYEADEFANLAWDCWAAGFAASDLPPPEEVERFAVPCNDWYRA